MNLNIFVDIVIKFFDYTQLVNDTRSVRIFTRTENYDGLESLQSVPGVQGRKLFLDSEGTR